jgi:hypothetical protein
LLSSLKFEGGIHERICGSGDHSYLDRLSYILHVKNCKNDKLHHSIYTLQGRIYTSPKYKIYTKLQNYKVMICLTLIPTTPPPRPSQPGIAALQTGHRATFSPTPIIIPILTPLCNVVLTAVNKHDPQQTCPQGVNVALEGGKKHIGHVYSDNGSSTFCG